VKVDVLKLVYCKRVKKLRIKLELEHFVKCPPRIIARNLSKKPANKSINHFRKLQSSHVLKETRRSRVCPSLSGR